VKEQAIPISEFKARCLQLLQEVDSRGGSLLVTKRGRPIAKVVPIPRDRASRMGDWADLVKIKGDIVNFDASDDWESL
jgi:prevent-host-death family protein